MPLRIGPCFLQIVCAIACLSSTRCVAVYTPYGNPVRLASISSLTFVKGHDTTHRRSSPIPQLLCLKGCDYEPGEVKCKNVLSSGRDVTWQCEADLPSHLTLDETEVNCEGYSSREDEEILEGSCGLEYSLAPHGSQPQRSLSHVLITAAVLMFCFYFMWGQRASWQFLMGS